MKPITGTWPGLISFNNLIPIKILLFGLRHMTGSTEKRGKGELEKLDKYRIFSCM